MPLSTILEAKIQAALTKVADLATISAPLLKSLSISWDSGTGANQADKAWGDQRTLGASATEDLDLAGVLTDEFGAVLTFVKLKAMLVYAAIANTNLVQVTRPAVNGVPLFMAAGDGIALRPGALFLWFSPDVTGVAVTAGTGDLITFTNSGAGTGVTYDVMFIGTSA